MRKTLGALASIAAIGISLPALAYAQDLGSLGSAGGAPVPPPPATVTETPDPVTSTQMVPTTITQTIPTTITQVIPTTVDRTVPTTVTQTLTTTMTTTVTTTVPAPAQPSPGELSVLANPSTDGLHYSVRAEVDIRNQDAAFTTLQYRTEGDSGWETLNFPADPAQVMQTDAVFLFGVTYEFRARQLLGDNQVTEWSPVTTKRVDRTYAPAAPVIGFDDDYGTNPYGYIVWSHSRDLGLVCNRFSDAGSVPDCPGNGKYEVQTANSVNFSDAESQVVDSNYFDRTLPPRNEWFLGARQPVGFTYYRIRAVDLWGNVGPWSNVLARPGGDQAE